MPIRVLVNGAFGRMGQVTVKAIEAHPELELAGQTGKEYDLTKAIHDSKAQVVVDFTHADFAWENINKIIEAGARPVFGTSGLKTDQIKKLQEKCAQLELGGIIAPNFSLGGVLMMKCAKDIVKYLPRVEIIEMHHDGKVDAPSGTAMRTAAMMEQACPEVNQPLKVSKEIIPGSLGAVYHNVPIHAVRLPGYLAHQQVLFGSQGESLTIRHDSIDRACFMPGVCLACVKVMEMDRLVYGLEEIL